ncbi:hypothetical protein PMI07_006499 [Rhizobium sp. CF080]|nr:hypothetical protein PMI07_006499 [Rhizobium sp. CF080]
MGNALSCGNHVGILAPLQGVEPGTTFKSAVGQNKKAVNGPGTRQDLVQFWKRRIGPTVLIELPGRKTEPSLGAIQAEHLAVLTLWIDRDPRNAKKI